MSLESKSHSEVVGPARDSAPFNDLLLFIPLPCNAVSSSRLSPATCTSLEIGSDFGSEIQSARCFRGGLQGDYNATFLFAGPERLEEQTHGDMCSSTSRLDGAILYTQHVTGIHSFVCHESMIILYAMSLSLSRSCVHGRGSHRNCSTQILLQSGLLRGWISVIISTVIRGT